MKVPSGLGQPPCKPRSRLIDLVAVPLLPRNLFTLRCHCCLDRMGLCDYISGSGGVYTVDHMWSHSWRRPAMGFSVRRRRFNGVRLKVEKNKPMQSQAGTNS